MRKYRSNAASTVRVAYGIELAAGLRVFSETAALADGFEQLNDRLDAAHTARVALRKPRLQVRARLRLASYHVDAVIRSVARAAEIADGGRRGPIYLELFPDGVTPVVAPTGRRQIEPTRRLVDRMTRSQRTGLAQLRQVWAPRLSAALGALEQLADDHAQARDAYLDAFRTELALRNEHLLAVDRLIGHIRAAFPRDRARQNVVFPVRVNRDRNAGRDRADDTGDTDRHGR